MSDLIKLLVVLVSNLFRSRSALEAEVLVLRQQVVVLRHVKPGRLQFDGTYRWVVDWVCRLFPNACDSQASGVERLRAEEAALKATLKTELSPATERAPIPLAPPPTVTQISKQPAAELMISPTALTSTPTEDEATRAAQSSQVTQEISWIGT